MFKIFGLCYDSGLGFGGEAIGVKNWYDPGPARKSWEAFFSIVVTAAFSYSGIELIGLAAAEMNDPVKDLPKGVKNVFWRILMAS